MLSDVKHRAAPGERRGLAAGGGADHGRLSAGDEAIVAAREQADLVLALVHWGDENTAVVTERQRELARWLIDAGVDAIAGSHPHCIQPLDHYRGRPIAYSLGNLVFDGAPTVAGWNKGNQLEVDVTSARFPKTRTIAIQLDERGFPQLMPRQPSVAGSP